MKIIYHCYGRAHSSVTAAHLHLGHLPMEGPVYPKDIIALPLFDRATRDDFGTPYYMGEDTNGNAIYILGLGGMTQVCGRTIESVLRVFGCSQQVLLVDALSSIGISTRIGGTLSRELHWVTMGRPLVAWGICRSLPRIRKLVRSVQEAVQQNNG